MSPTLETRYWAKVEVLGPDECWPWTAATAGPMTHGTIYYGNRRAVRETWARRDREMRL